MGLGRFYLLLLFCFSGLFLFIWLVELWLLFFLVWLADIALRGLDGIFFLLIDLGCVVFFSSLIFGGRFV